MFDVEHIYWNINEKKKKTKLCKIYFYLVSQELVDGLYHFRDHYFETHSVDNASRKQNDVAQEMNKTLKKLEEKEGEFNLHPQII